jgi:integrase
MQRQFQGMKKTSCGKVVSYAVFYAIGKIFCLRGCQEHRALRLLPLQRDGDKYVYRENVSKNRNGSFKQLHINSKVVPVFPCSEAKERCPVYLLDLYISKLPTEAKEDYLYVRPLDKKLQDPTLPWYSPVPLGKHTLQQKVKKMCAEAGISSHKTNHSLRATGATELYKKGAPEKL